MYGYIRPGTNGPTVTMKQFETSLCDKHLKDPYLCIDCEKPCPNGKEATKRLEKETRKPMSKQQLGAAEGKINAMNKYLEAMEAPDPVKFIMEKYSCKNERLAKNKLYQWQHNYGTNLVAVAESVKDLKDEIADTREKYQETKSKSAAVNSQMKNESPDDGKPVIDSKTQATQPEEKKITRRQEEKISQSHLEIMRGDLEKEFLQREAEIEEHKKEIKFCENRMEEITNQIQAIRQVLEIFKAKDKLYV